MAVRPGRVSAAQWRWRAIRIRSLSPSTRSITSCTSIQSSGISMARTQDPRWCSRQLGWPGDRQRDKWGDLILYRRMCFLCFCFGTVKNVAQLVITLVNEFYE
ncbi:hypothetical protein BS78_01G042300 [Paspalum vaginatum]|nr:hypothetical protein BS78_01G042300 [Paspalum vaginatum]